MSQTWTQTTALLTPRSDRKPQRRQVHRLNKEAPLGRKPTLARPPVATGRTGSLRGRTVILASQPLASARGASRLSLDGLAPKKRGVKPDPLALENAQLRCEIKHLEAAMQPPNDYRGGGFQKKSHSWLSFADRTGRKGRSA